MKKVETVCDRCGDKSHPTIGIWFWWFKGLTVYRDIDLCGPCWTALEKFFVEGRKPDAGAERES